MDAEVVKVNIIGSVSPIPYFESSYTRLVSTFRLLQCKTPHLLPSPPPVFSYPCSSLCGDTVRLGLRDFKELLQTSLQRPRKTLLYVFPPEAISKYSEWPAQAKMSPRDFPAIHTPLQRTYEPLWWHPLLMTAWGKKKDLHFVQDILAVGGYLERAGGSALKSGWRKGSEVERQSD